MANQARLREVERSQRDQATAAVAAAMAAGGGQGGDAQARAEAAAHARHVASLEAQLEQQVHHHHHTACAVLALLSRALVRVNTCDGLRAFGVNTCDGLRAFASQLDESQLTTLLLRSKTVPLTRTPIGSLVRQQARFYQAELDKMHARLDGALTQRTAPVVTTSTTAAAAQVISQLSVSSTLHAEGHGRSLLCTCAPVYAYVGSVPSLHHPTLSACS